MLATGFFQARHQRQKNKTEEVDLLPQRGTRSYSEWAPEGLSPEAAV
jgi:hypothetical protein